ncbi:MAG: type II CAAX prenyl endopeptidase Rce1 family protein [Candidatus Hodarchaeota archaeon]
MRKIEIVEIENSFLNFFTPAVLVAISYFFFNLIGWPSIYILHLLENNPSIITIDLNLVKLLIYNGFFTLICFSLYYLLIYHPRLKVSDAEFKGFSKYSLYIAISFFFLMILSETIITTIYEIFFSSLEINFSSFIPPEVLFDNPFYMLLFLIYDIILVTLFIEFVYRRALIPMLEDRGLSPFHAVILAALGSSFIDLPGYALNPNHPVDIYSFCLSIFIGLCAGLIYVSTRNIFFPIVSVICYQVFSTFGLIAPEELLAIYESLNILLLVISFGIIIIIIYGMLNPSRSPKWLRIIKQPSSPFVMRGVSGFFIISLGLLTLQTIVAKIGRILFVPVRGDVFPEYFIYISIFYAIAFTIPFFLTISTEWASSPTN